MAFESLTDKLQAVFKNLKGKGRLSEADVKEALKQVKMALLEADVNYKIVKDFLNALKRWFPILLGDFVGVIGFGPGACSLAVVVIAAHFVGRK